MLHSSSSSKPLRAPPGSRARHVAADRSQGYAVEWAPGLDELPRRLAQSIGSRRSLWITTPTVDRLYTRRLFADWRARARGAGDAELVVLPCSEPTKALPAAVSLCDAAQSFDFDRRSLFVVVGGGVISDIVTLAASMVRRGVSHLRVPTTLLGLVDAGIGAKGGVNHGGRKNSLGCFHPPESVLICPGFTETLPARQIRSGLAEILKVALARDGELFARLEADGPAFVELRGQVSPEVSDAIVWSCITNMLADLEPNLFEDRTYERRMDLGHAFCPTLESACGFARLHGEAVAIDLALSTVLAQELGWLAAADAERILGLMDRLGLPTYDALLDAELCRVALDEITRHRGGQLLLFVPDGVGSVRCLRERSDLPDTVLEAALACWEARCR